MLTQAQKEAILDRGSDPELVELQIRNFVAGFPFLNLEKPALVGDGILRLDINEVEEYQQYYDAQTESKKILKFVPASGAASRMFKDLFAFVERGDNQLSGASEKFIQGLENFAFYEDLKASLAGNGKDMDDMLTSGDYVGIVSELLSESGLGYGKLPKGLLRFHSYEEGNRTSMEEHLVEGARYAVGGGNEVNIHFTVSPEHRQKFESLVAEAVPAYEQKLGVTYNISFSEQKKSTDTIAVDMDNEPFLEKDGSILFRPAGHGALLENLNDLEAEVIFIKNIDNVVPDRIKGDTVTFKKVLGGVLLKTQAQVFNFLDQIESGNAELPEIEAFLSSNLGLSLPHDYQSMSEEEKRDFLVSVLDRPIKVCGMVVNKGEPGGGPFWVAAQDGSQSLQIAESAQIDMDDESQVNILKNSSHFNPVDLVCGVTNRNGEYYDLLKYRDPSTGFITEKSKDGRELKAPELPGLWNGAMAFWNTIFVEVPIITFNPVKTVNDLLREQHQN